MVKAKKSHKKSKHKTKQDRVCVDIPKNLHNTIEELAKAANTTPSVILKRMIKTVDEEIRDYNERITNRVVRHLE